MNDIDDIPSVGRMRNNIRKLWPRKSKKFDGFERVSLHVHTPEYGDKTPIHFAIPDPAGEFCIHRRDFERPGYNPAWQNAELRRKFNRLSRIPWRVTNQIVKLWTGETPSCIKTFQF